ncbi:heavy metal sensor histidine kinase [Xylophilus sp. GOD-11R]|uniref:heavy metal sensor histidine kinase n=1 Tax=Xylophilus sp. GOD-11R TaxID=3089814 RepID=UPI00298D40D7|nr:heavy metal sensor histidine kinase [Xylophilus sp. GOD-11R]WPB56912.1 heavy metal sensor histidine kinase [Xylophilus sp. GOD-11R]
MIRRLSLTARLTVLFSLVSAGVLLGLALLIDRAVEAHFVEEDYVLLEDKVELLRRIAAEHPQGPPAARLAAALGDHAGLLALVRDADGRLLYASPGITLQAPHPDAEGAQAWQQDGRQLRALQARIGDGPGALRALVATDTAMHEHFQHGFRRTLGFYGVLAALFSGLLGWWAARSGLKPLRAIASRADAVNARRLDARMPVDTAPVEMRELARNLNAMLGRLQDDFGRLSEFSSDLAHELRTPLTNLMTQTQVALSQPRGAAQYEEILASNAEELQRLARMVSDMLYLAQVEQGTTLASREPVVLADEVASLFDFYEALAEARGVGLRLQGEAALVGDRLMLRRALGNLLSNALRYTPAGGTIELRLDTDPAGVRIAVENPGQDIPAALQPTLFDRFVRGDKSRVRVDLDGAGLGLAITRAIARAHGGDIELLSAGGVTRFTLVLPASPATIRSTEQSATP